MHRFAEVFLGILTAVGGFVEIGELTFTLTAGSTFGYTLLWTTVLGTIGIILYCEMAGRIAAVQHRAVFSLIRERTGFTAALVTLIASTVVNVLTCAAEVGGVALIWQLLSTWSYRGLVLAALAFFVLVIWSLKFEWIERVFGLGGLLMIVYIASAFYHGPSWSDAVSGLVPHPPEGSAHQGAVYWYYAVAIMSSIMLPYETYFYASGAIEDKWKPADITLNRVIVIVGFALGALLSVALVSLGAEFFGPRKIEPQLPGTAALSAALAFGRVGLFAALLGMFFAFAGAAIETALSSAYNIAQFLGWPWGKYQKPRDAARFTLAWVIVFVVCAVIMITGVDPVRIVEYSIVFSVIVLPFTYLPVLVVAADKRIMGAHANGIVVNVLGWIYLVVITLAAIAAIPLFLSTHGGQG